MGNRGIGRALQPITAGNSGSYLYPYDRAITPRLLRTVIVGESVATGFFSGVSRVPAPQVAADGGEKLTKTVNNMTKNIRFYNRIAVHISLYSQGGATLRPAFGKTAQITAAANQALDQALRREMDRELSLMARGEDIASNRRRRRMLGNYLLAQPAKAVHRFYSASILTLAREYPAGNESSGFYSDILHENSEYREKTVVERHTESIRYPAIGRDAVPVSDLERIAVRVADKVEKRMKLNQERTGRW